jgi:hypothetical protein
MSWRATDAVLHLFERKDKASEFIMLVAIAHHYNDSRRDAFPTLETLAEILGCKKRSAIRIRNRLLSGGDIFILEKGGGRGRATVFGLSSRYVGSDSEKVTANGHSFGKTKGDQARARNSDKACARKGDRPPRQNVPQSNKTKRKQAAAASAVAEPPPPLLTEEDLAAVARLRAAFKERHGRELGANIIMTDKTFTKWQTSR